jgi:hypothetical protein
MNASGSTRARLISTRPAMVSASRVGKRGAGQAVDHARRADQQPLDGRQDVLEGAGAAEGAQRVRGRAAGQDQAGDPVAVAQPGLERHLHAHRVAAQHRALDRRVVEDGGDVVGEVGDRHPRWIARRLRPAVAAVVPVEDAAGDEIPAQVAPDEPVAADPVAQHDRRAGGDRRVGRPPRVSASLRLDRRVVARVLVEQPGLVGRSGGEPPPLVPSAAACAGA